MRRGSDQPKIRRSVGEGFSGMTCPSCFSPSVNALVAVNGAPYMSCSTCRFKVFGLTLRSIAGLRFLLGLMSVPTVRQHYDAAVAATEAAVRSAPAAAGDVSSAPSPTPSRAEVLDEEAA